MAFAYAGIKVNLEDGGLNQQVNKMTTRWKSAMESMSTEAEAFDNRWQQAMSGIKDTKRIIAGILVSQTFYTLSNVMADASAAAFQFSRDMETAAISMEYFVKGADKAQKAAAYLREINIFAARTPFSTQDALALSKYMQAMGVGMENTKGFLKVITDTAAATGATEQNLQRITFGLGQMLTKGRIANEEIRQLANANIPIYEILQEQLGLTGEQISKIGNYWVSADKAVVAILRGLEKRYEGAADRVAETVTGMLDTFKDNSLIIVQQAGIGAYEKLADKMRVVRDLLDDYRDVSTQLGSAGLFTQVLIDLDASGKAGQLVLNLIGNVRLLASALKEVTINAMPLIKLLGTTAYTQVSVLGYSLTALARATSHVIVFFDKLTDKLGITGDALEKFGTGLASLFIAYKSAHALSFLGQGLSKLGHGFYSLITVMGASLPFMARWTTASKLLTASVMGGAAAIAIYLGFFASLNNLMSGLNPKSSNILPDDYMEAYEKYAADMQAYNDEIAKYQESFNAPFEDLDASGDVGVNAFEDVANASKKAAKSVKSDWVAAFDEVYSIPDKALSGSGNGLPALPDFGAFLSLPAFAFPTRSSADPNRAVFPWEEVFGGSPLDKTITEGLDDSLITTLLLAGILPALLKLGKIFNKNGSMPDEPKGGIGSSGGSGLKATIDDNANTLNKKFTVNQVKLDAIDADLKRILSEIKKGGLSAEETKNLLAQAQEKLNYRQKLTENMNGILHNLGKSADSFSVAATEEISKLVDRNNIESLVEEAKAIRLSIDSAADELKDPLRSKFNSVIKEIDKASSSYALKYGAEDIASSIEGYSTLSGPQRRQQKLVAGINEIIELIKAGGYTGAGIEGPVNEMRKLAELIYKDIADGVASLSTMSEATQAALNRINLLSQLVRDNNSLQAKQNELEALKAQQDTRSANRALNPAYGNVNFTDQIGKVSDEVKRLDESIKYKSRASTTPLERADIDTLKNKAEQINRNTAFNNTVTDRIVTGMPSVLKPITAMSKYSKKFLYTTSETYGYLQMLVSGVAKMDEATSDLPEVNKVIKDLRKDLIVKSGEQLVLTKEYVASFRAELIQAFRDYGLSAGISPAYIDHAIQQIEEAFDNAAKSDKVLNEIKKTRAELRRGGKPLTPVQAIHSTTSKILKDTKPLNLDAREERFATAIEDLSDKYAEGQLKAPEVYRAINNARQIFTEEAVVALTTQVADSLDNIIERNIGRDKLFYKAVDKWRETIQGKYGSQVYNDPRIQEVFDYAVKMYEEETERQNLIHTTPYTELPTHTVKNMALDELAEKSKEQIKAFDGLTEATNTLKQGATELYEALPEEIKESNKILSKPTTGKLTAVLSAGESAGMFGHSGYGKNTPSIIISNLNPEEVGEIYLPGPSTSSLINMTAGSIFEDPALLALKQKLSNSGFELYRGAVLFTPDATLQAQFDGFIGQIGNLLGGIDLKVNQSTKYLEKILVKFGTFENGIWKVSEEGFEALLALKDDIGYQFAGQAAILGKASNWGAFLDLSKMGITLPAASDPSFSRLDPIRQTDLIKELAGNMIRENAGQTDLIQRMMDSMLVVEFEIPASTRKDVKQAGHALMEMQSTIARFDVPQIQELLQLRNNMGMVIGDPTVRHQSASLKVSTPIRELNTYLVEVTKNLSSKYSSQRATGLARLNNVIDILTDLRDQEPRRIIDPNDKDVGRLIYDKTLVLENLGATNSENLKLLTKVTPEQLNKSIDVLETFRGQVDNRLGTLTRQFDDYARQAAGYAKLDVSLNEIVSGDKPVEHAVNMFRGTTKNLLKELGIENNTAATMNEWKEAGKITRPVDTSIGSAGYTVYADALKEILAVQSVAAASSAATAAEVLAATKRTNEERNKLGFTTQNVNSNRGSSSEWSTFRYNTNYGQPGAAGKFYAGMGSDPESFLKFFEKARYAYFKDPASMNAAQDAAKFAEEMAEALKRMEEANQRYVYSSKFTRGGTQKTTTTESEAYKAASKAAKTAADEAAKAAASAVKGSGTAYSIFGKTIKVPDKVSGNIGNAAMIALMIPAIVSEVNKNKSFKEMVAGLPKDKQAAALSRGTTVGDIAGMGLDTYLQDYREMTEQERMFWGSQVISGKSNEMLMLPDKEWQKYMDVLSGGDTTRRGASDMFVSKYINKESDLDRMIATLADKNSGLAKITDYLLKTGDTTSPVAKEFYKRYGDYMDSVIMPSVGFGHDWVAGVNQLLGSEYYGKQLSELGITGPISGAGDLEPGMLSIVDELMGNIRSSMQDYYTGNVFDPARKYNTANNNPLAGDVSAFVGGLDAGSMDESILGSLKDTLGITFESINDAFSGFDVASVMKIDSKAIEDNIIGWTQALPDKLDIGDISVQDAQILARAGIQINSDGTVTFMKAMNADSSGAERVVTLQAEDIAPAVASALSLKGLELDFSGAETKLNLDLPALSAGMTSALFMLNKDLTGQVSDDMTAAINGLGRITESGYFEITNKAVLSGSQTIEGYIAGMGDAAARLSPELVEALKAIDNIIAQEGELTKQSVVKWADGIRIESPLKAEELTAEMRAGFAEVGVIFEEENEKLYAIINKPGEQLKDGIAILPQSEWDKVNERVRKSLEDMGLIVTSSAGITMLDFNTIMEKGLSDVIELYVNNAELWNIMPDEVVKMLEQVGLKTEEGMVKIDLSLLNGLTPIGDHWYQTWSTLPEEVINYLGAAGIATENGLMEIQEYVEGMDTTGGLVRKFAELPPTVQEYLKQTAGAIGDPETEYLITNATEDAFLGFVQAVSDAMADAKEQAEEGATAIADAIRNAMLDIKKLDTYSSSKDWINFGDRNKPDWSVKNGVWYVSYQGRDHQIEATSKAEAIRLFKLKGLNIPASAYGSIVDGDQLVRVGEFGKSEAIVPLEQPSVMAKLGTAIANTMPTGIGAGIDEQTKYVFLGAIKQNSDNTVFKLSEAINGSTSAMTAHMSTLADKGKVSIDESVEKILSSNSDIITAIQTASADIGRALTSSSLSSGLASSGWTDSGDDMTDIYRAPKTLTVGADGRSPDGAMIGDTIITSGGDHAFKIVKPNTKDAVYNPDTNKWSVQLRDNGGILRSGTAALNLSNRDEQVLDPNQTKAFNYWMTQAPVIFRSMHNGGVSINRTQQQQQGQPYVDVSALTKQVLETILPAVSNNTGMEDKTPVYVGTLIADERGIKELERKMYDIRKIEATRR